MQQPSPPLIDAGLEALVDRLAAEMAAAWRRGERPGADDYLRAHPELAAHAQAGIRLVYEEICLRDEHGEPVATREVVRRFPQWQHELQLMLDAQRLLGVGAAPPAFPAEGERLGEFRVVAEI